jgi:chromosome partitioning protein
MPIIVVGGIKGGSGKTTIASNLVVIRSLEDKKKVLLVDSDEQKSISDWVTHRESQSINTPWTTVSLFGPSVRTQIMKMQNDYDDIIIDTGGRDTTSQRSALTLADIFIVPFQPRSFDVWTVGNVVSIINEIKIVNPKLKTFFFINRGDSTGSDNQGAAEILKEIPDVYFIPTLIGQRKAFAHAAAEGLGVGEMTLKDKKAINEIEQLKTYILNNYNDTKKA